MRDADEGTAVYLAFTPYHLLITHALQIGTGGRRAALVYSDEAQIANRLPALLSPPGVVARRILPAVERLPGWRQPVPARRNARAAASAVASFSGTGDEVVVFNGLRTEAQRIGRRFGKERCLHFAEDGLDAYVACNQHPVAAARRLAHRAAFGRRHPESSDTFSALQFSSYRMLVPELARHDVGGRSVVRIEPDWLVEAVVSLAASVDGATDPQGWSAASRVWFLRNSHSVSDRPGYLGDIARWTDRRQHGGADAPALKPHPRESDRSFLQAIEALDAMVLPHWAPAELLAPRMRPDCLLRSGLSTFVLTSRFLLPGRRIELEPGTDNAQLELLRAWDPRIEAVS